MLLIHIKTLLKKRKVIYKNYMKNLNFIKVEKDSPDHVKYLYKILKKRIYSISHNRLPSLSEHREFVSQHPYRLWNIIKLNNEIIGAFYLCFDNSVGINLINPELNVYLEIIKKILITYTPLKERKSLRSKYFIFNSNPKNHTLIEALEKIGFKHIQNTYAYKNI